MRVCVDKTCEGVLCEECKDLKPSICGDRGLPMPNDNCDVIRFEGVEDTEINQGVCIDLTEGIHAYDGDGSEIPYTVSPSEIGCCDVGEHEITYTAMGKGNKMLPSFCLGKPMLTTANCGLMTKAVTRLVTVLQALPPKILGIGRTIIPPSTTFDPMSGVSGVDDNGNETEVTYEGRYDLSTGKQNIASFESDIEQNAKSLKVALEPIQDLNGYDKPWSGGNGKNKYSIKIGRDEFGNNVGATHTSDNDTLTVVCTASNDSGVYSRAISELQALIGAYSEPITYSFDIKASAPATISVGYQGYGQKNVSVTTSWQRVSITTTGDGVKHSFVVYNKSTSDVTVDVKDFMLELGSTATSYEPYSNICPISGRTECVTSVCGKNLIPYPYKAASGTYSGVTYSINSGGTVNLHGTATSTIFVDLFGRNTTTISYLSPLKSIGLKAGDTITLSSNYSGRFLIQFNKADGTLTSPGSIYMDNGVATTATIPSNAEYCYIAFRLVNGTSVNQDNVWFMIQKGSTATSYEPFIGNTHTTSLGRTVYGGTLDVVSGVLTVDRAISTYDGTEGWVLNPSGVGRFYLGVLPSGIDASHKTESISNIASYYDRNDVYGAFLGIGSAGVYFNKASASQTLDDFTSQLATTNAQLVYPLATPQTIQLTPQQVQLLLGTNNVWSDGGEVEVIYSKPFEGATQLDIEGVYPITYHTEDSCGNETTETRCVFVTDDDISVEDTYAVACQGKTCYAVISCDEA